MENTVRQKEDDDVRPLAVLIPCRPGEAEGKDVWNQAAQRPVRRVLAEEFAGDRPKTWWTDLSERDKEVFKGIAQLRQAIATKDQAAIEEACVRLAPELIGVIAGESPEQRAQLAQKYARLYAGEKKASRLLARVTSEKLESVRFVLARLDNHLTPALFCPDLRTAVFAHLLIRAAGGREVLLCPKCKRLFVQQRPDQQFCSIRCREANRMARHYLKKREQISERRRKRRQAKK